MICLNRNFNDKDLLFIRVEGSRIALSTFAKLAGFFNILRLLFVIVNDFFFSPFLLSELIDTLRYGRQILSESFSDGWDYLLCFIFCIHLKTARALCEIVEYSFA